MRKHQLKQLKKLTKAVTEPTVEETVKVVDSTSAVEDETPQEEQSLVKEAVELIEMAKMCQVILAQFVKGSRNIQQGIRKMERDLRKLDKRLKTKKNSKSSTNGNKGLQQLKPIYTTTMKDFFEKFHTLKDRNGDVIYENLQYDSEHLLVSRDHALKLVTSYVRENQLQKYDNKKRIKMDVELSKLFP